MVQLQNINQVTPTVFFIEIYIRGSQEAPQVVSPSRYHFLLALETGLIAQSPHSMPRRPFKQINSKISLTHTHPKKEHQLFSHHQNPYIQHSKWYQFL